MWGRGAWGVRTLDPSQLRFCRFARAAFCVKLCDELGVPVGVALRDVLGACEREVHFLELRFQSAVPRCELRVSPCLSLHERSLLHRSSLQLAQRLHALIQESHRFVARVLIGARLFLGGFARRALRFQPQLDVCDRIAGARKRTVRDFQLGFEIPRLLRVVR